MKNMTSWPPRTKTTPTSHDAEEESHNGSVSKVEQVAKASSDASLTSEIDQWIEEEIEASGACGKKWPPPPAVVLGTKMTITEKDGDFSTHHNQHQIGQQNEPKQGVHLA